MSFKYFSGVTQLVSLIPVPNSEFLAIGGVMSKHNAYDSFKRLAGKSVDGEILPVTRSIKYSRNPSRHKCDARCRNSKGHTCECECGGKNHGAG